MLLKQHLQQGLIPPFRNLFATMMTQAIGMLATTVQIHNKEMIGPSALSVQLITWPQTTCNYSLQQWYHNHLQPTGQSSSHVHCQLST
jgi:hypothetical protein